MVAQYQAFCTMEGTWFCFFSLAITTFEVLLSRFDQRIGVLFFSVDGRFMVLLFMVVGRTKALLFMYIRLCPPPSG